MRPESPFMPEDLAELDERLLSRAAAVVALREVYAGNRKSDVIQMRHDVDDNSGSWDAAVLLAGWEAGRGYRSTYYLLHTAKYWGSDGWKSDVQYMARMGHEIGIHADALAHCVRHGGDPHDVLTRAIYELRCTGVPVRSVVGHGNRICRTLSFANDEQFVECARTQYGPSDRWIKSEVGSAILKIEPHSLDEYELDFEAVRLGRAWQLSDSGGNWSATPFEDTVSRFPDPNGQLHFLMHPDWWTQAL